MSISREGVLERLEKPGCVVLNVMSEREYLERHIRGSRSLPFQGDGPAFAREVDEKYGKGPFFILYGSNLTSYEASAAVEALQQEGFRVEAYLSGLKDWNEARLPVESGA